MRLQELTISLPEKIYQQMQKQSQETKRSVADEVTAVVAASIPEQTQLPLDLEEELAQLELFTDQELWRAAQVTAPDDQTARMQDLVEKQQLEGLTAVEKAEARLLSNYFNRVMLVRAKAAVLLQSRGYDIDQLIID